VLQQLREGGAGVEVTAALLGIVERQQQLRHLDVVRGERIGPGLHQQRLAGGGGGLFLGKVERARPEPDQPR
jgi:hypothetical protein